VLFFLLLVLLAIVLLSLESKRLEVKRPEMDADFANQRANTFLISLLRSPAALGYQGTGQKAPIADIIIMDEDSRYDDGLLVSITDATPSDVYLQLTITFGNGRKVTFQNAEKLVIDTPSALVGAAGYDPNAPTTIGKGSAMLPGRSGNIAISIVYADKQLFEQSGNAIPKIEWKKKDEASGTATIMGVAGYD